MRWRLVLIVGLVFVAAANQKKPATPKPVTKKVDPVAAAKADRAKLQGAWQVVKVVSDGIEVAEAGIAKMEVIIKDDKLTRKEDEDEEENTFTLDAGKEPRAFDLTPTSEERKDKKVQGIYKLDGDTLKLCLANPGKARPKEFASKPETDHELIVLTRKK